MQNSSTYIDGNNRTFLNLLIEHQNDCDILLNEVADPGYGTENPSSASLNFDNILDLAVDGASIVLNGNTLTLGQAGLLSGFSGNRPVVSGNNLQGHLVKDFADANKNI